MAVGRRWVWHGDKSFIIKGRGSSVVEQPIRNRQVASSTLALGSNIPFISSAFRTSIHRSIARRCMDVAQIELF
jgi:hypothetical protein